MIVMIHFKDGDKFMQSPDAVLKRNNLTFKYGAASFYWYHLQH